MSITLENITYIYGEHTPFEKRALDGVSVSIEKGEFVGIIGHTGSGKSTLIQHCNGLLVPTSGTVYIDGVDIGKKGREAKSMRYRVGMVFQYPEHQLFEETIEKDIAFGPKNLGLSEEEVTERVKRAMEFVGLSYEVYAKRSPFQLSGGQMRRVAIAGVIALEPEYLILDEPSAGLDPIGRAEIFENIVRLHKERGVTVILVSHNMEDISYMASRVLVMHEGRICIDGAPLDVFIHQKEALRRASVDVPPVSKLIESLRKKGLSVSEEAITVSDAARNIYSMLQEVGHAT